jgi:hypothetical protein
MTVEFCPVPGYATPTVPVGSGPAAVVIVRGPLIVRVMDPFRVAPLASVTVSGMLAALAGAFGVPVTDVLAVLVGVVILRP